MQYVLIFEIVLYEVSRKHHDLHFREKGRKRIGELEKDGWIQIPERWTDPTRAIDYFSWLHNHVAGYLRVYSDGKYIRALLHSVKMRRRSFFRKRSPMYLRGDVFQIAVSSDAPSKAIFSAIREQLIFNCAQLKPQLYPDIEWLENIGEYVNLRDLFDQLIARPTSQKGANLPELPHPADFEIITI